MPAVHRILYHVSPHPGPVLSGYGTGVVPQFPQRRVAVTDWALHDSMEDCCKHEFVHCMDVMDEI